MSFGLAVTCLIGLLRNRAPNAPTTQIPPVGPGTVRLVCQYPVRPGARPARRVSDPDAAQDHLRLGRVAALSRSDHQRQQSLSLLGGQMQFRGPAAPGPTQRVISRLHLAHPGRRLLLRIPLFRARIRAQTPARCHRRNNPYTACHDPYAAGTSRHGAPTRTRHRIPSMSCRFVHFDGRPDFFPFGSSGPSTAHCASVKSARPVTATLATRSPVLTIFLVDDRSTGDLVYLSNDTPTSHQRKRRLASTSRHCLAGQLGVVAG